MRFDFKWIRDYSEYYYLGMLFPASIAVGVAIGYYADRWLHTDPWGKLLGFVLGVVAGGISFYRDYQKLVKKDRDSKKS